MKHLIIYAHPNETSLNHYIKTKVEQLLKDNKHEVRTRDLYELQLQPVLTLDDMGGQRKGLIAADVKLEQDHISWADSITFIYPIWWTGMPAIMKGYIDRVFSYGFAYRYDQGIQKGLLKGKSAFIINTHGKSEEEYKQIGMDKALSLTSDKGVYTYCGLDVIAHFFIDQADRAMPETINKWTFKIEKSYTKYMLTYDKTSSIT